MDTTKGRVARTDTLSAVGLLFSAHLRSNRRGWPSPHTASERRYVDDFIIGGIELDPRDVRERQFIEGSPSFPVVAREPEARSGRILGQGHVNPDVVFRVEIAAESLWPWHSTYPTAC